MAELRKNADGTFEYNLNRIHPLDLAELLVTESGFMIETAEELEEGEDVGSIVIHGKVYIQDATIERTSDSHFIE